MSARGTRLFSEQEYFRIQSDEMKKGFDVKWIVGFSFFVIIEKVHTTHHLQRLQLQQRGRYFHGNVRSRLFC